VFRPNAQANIHDAAVFGFSRLLKKSLAWRRQA
jgi:hypothetical protein